MKTIKILLVFVLLFFSIYFGKKYFTNYQQEVIVSRPNPTARPTQITAAKVVANVTIPPLPDYYLNKTAFIPQAPEKNWEQPWQDACEEAGILTVKYFFESKTPDLSTLLDDYKLLFSRSSTHDINVSQMAAIANKLYGYKSEIFDNPDIDTIEKVISTGQILIAPANGQILYRENKHFKSGGPLYHAVVILGYDHAKKIFIVHDVGTQFGAYFNYSYDLLIESLHDFPSSGNKADINQGTPRLLLLLK